MGELIRKIGSSDISGIRAKISKNKKTKGDDITPKDICTIGDNSPHSADIHTHRARLLKNIASKTNQLMKETKEPGHGEIKTEKFGLGDILDFLTGDKEVNETPSNTDINQTQYLKDLTDTLGPLTRIQNQQDISKLNGRIPTISELNDEFNKLAANPKIPYEYIIDGCYARAHLMCETMMEDKINCSKMFVMKESIWGKGMLKASNKFMNAEWWYHVAPLTFAQDEKTGKVEGYIMDPGMSDKPMKAEDWIGAMWDKSFKIKVDVTRVPQYGPLEGGEENKTFEESLPGAKETLKDYSKVLAQIKEDYYGEHPDEKPPDKNLAGNFT